PRDLLRTPRPQTHQAAGPRRRTDAEDPCGARRELRRLRRPEGMAYAEPTTARRRAADRALHTVERLMGELGLTGAARGKVKRTTISDPRTPKPLDLVDRNFRPLAPNRLWVADFTYVSTWSGWCYSAFVIDAYARRILGWSVATTMTSQLVVDAVEQAIWTRQHEGNDLAGLIAHHDHGTQYLSVAYSQHLTTAGIKPSTGAVGSSYDNALAESVIGLYKTELVKPRRPWKGFDDLEIATAEWVDWFNHRRLYEYCGDMPPAELEAA